MFVKFGYKMASIFRVWKMSVVIFLMCYFVSCVQNITEVNFCSGRSQAVTISANKAFVMDGSSSAIYSTLSSELPHGTSCTCKITPSQTTDMLTVSLKTNINLEVCTKNLHITLPPDYDYLSWACVEHSYRLEDVGNREISISINFVNGTSLSDETIYQVLLGNPKLEDLTFKISCLSPAKISSSSTSSAPSSTTTTTRSTTVSTSPGIGTSTSSGTNGSSIQPTNSTDRTTGTSKTVVIVCAIVGVGLLLISLTICVICCIARRAAKSQHRDKPGPPRPRIYRRIAHTIRNLSDTLNLRRPLPTPPESGIHPKLQNRSKVFTTESGPYDSIKSSVRPIRLFKNGLRGGNNSSSSKTENGYINPVNDKGTHDDNGAPISSSNDKYITPVQGSQNVDNIHDDRNGEQSDMYMNSETEKIVLEAEANTEDPTSTYIDMSLIPDRGSDSGDNHQKTKTDVNTSNKNTSNETTNGINRKYTYVIKDGKKVGASPVRDEIDNSDNNSECHSVSDLYIDMRGQTDETRNPDITIRLPHDATNTQGDISVTHNEQNGAVTSNPRDSGYMSLSDIDSPSPKMRKASTKDKTFPNLFKFHVASIKPRNYFSKKRPPEVKPKPQKYIRNKAHET